jgi:hypothetical protein
LVLIGGGIWMANNALFNGKPCVAEARPGALDWL